MTASLTRLGETLRLGAVSESRRRRLLWALAAVVLVLGPIALDLSRATGFRASVHMLPVRVGPFRAVQDPAYYRSFLTDPELRREMRRHVGTVADAVAYRSVRISAAPGGIVVAAARLERPSDARDFVNALGPQLVGASGRQLLRASVRSDATIRRRLAGHLSARARRRARARLVALGKLSGGPQARALIASYAARPTLHRWADRVVDSLPGAFPSRPSPVWAGLAGALVAATLWAIGLVLFPPPGRAALRYRGRGAG